MNDKITIIIADDYDDTRVMMRRVLDQEGYRVIEALNGKEVIEFAAREHPDLILMDINMPFTDGINAARQIREIPGLGDVPIVAVSAHDSVDLHESALRAGCVGYFIKPIDADQLREFVLRFLPKAEKTGQKGDGK